MQLPFLTPKRRAPRAPVPSLVEEDAFVPLCWCYEVSEDDGETWRLEEPGDEARNDMRRRGAWMLLVQAH